MTDQTNPRQCDCTVWCGDDSWLKAGRAEPCEMFVRWQAEQRLQQAAPELLKELDILVGILHPSEAARYPGVIRRAKEAIALAKGDYTAIPNSPENAMRNTTAIHFPLEIDAAAETAEYPRVTPDILTAGGRIIDFLATADSTFDVEDIAHGLANLCRFTGQTRIFYSVAQHSVLTSHLVPQEDALAALFHDAAEAFLGDVSTPLKRLLPDYRAIEERMERALFEQLGLPYPMPQSVKAADRIMLATEKRDLMPEHDKAVKWALLSGITPLAERIVPAPPWAAKAMFLARVDELTREGK